MIVIVCTRPRLHDSKFIIFERKMKSCFVLCDSSSVKNERCAKQGDYDRVRVSCSFGFVRISHSMTCALRINHLGVGD